MPTPTPASTDRPVSTRWIEHAVRQPGAVFARPEDVLGHAGLTPAHKLEILRSWELDANELAVAVEFGASSEVSHWWATGRGSRKTNASC